jgi:hypothetical protein
MLSLKSENMGKDYAKIFGGMALIGIAITPTPDDVTVVSPIAQAALGIFAIYQGLKGD